MQDTQNTHKAKEPEKEPATASDTPSQPTRPNPKRIRVLLIVVLVLGMLLVSGFAVVVGTIIKRLNTPETASKIRSKKAFGAIDIIVPQGAQLISTQITENKLVLQLTGPEGDHLLIYDVRKGIELGRLKLVPEN